MLHIRSTVSFRFRSTLAYDFGLLLFRPQLPELVELVMAKPLVSAGMVAKTLEVTPQAARRIVLELGLREMTGRGRFRAWGLL